VTKWVAAWRQRFFARVSTQMRAVQALLLGMKVTLRKYTVTKYLQLCKRLSLVMLGATLLLVVCAVIFTPVPSFESVRASAVSSEATLLDRHGVEIERLRLDHKRRMLDWVALDQVSPMFQRSILAAEDKRFYWHPGVDPVGAVSALVDNLHRTHARGASTITMQLASVLANKQTSTHTRGWYAKLRQAKGALAIELHWSKREILEAYLNRVPFRGELVGIGAAAQGLLVKGPSGLDDADAAVLASLVRAPSASRITIAKRACATIKAIHQEETNTTPQQIANLCERAAFLASSLPQYPYPMRGADDAPHLARRLLTQPGEQKRVALNASLQRFAHETLRTHLAELSQQNVEDGAVVVLDNVTGEVLAYVGSSGDLSGAPEVG
jgi:penicillin-binding protein 1C